MQASFKYDHDIVALLDTDVITPVHFMRILSIDTTSMMGSVALTDGGRLVAGEQQGATATHSARLITSIEHLFSIAGWRPAEIDAIAVAVGPGSFTGLRTGLGTAKGMAFALGVPIAGVSSLESLALNGAGFSGSVLTLIDARRGELYAAVWKCAHNCHPKAVIEECVLPPYDLIRRLKKVKGDILLVGDGAVEYGQRIKKALGSRLAIAAGAQCLPQAANLAFLALPRLEKGKGDDIASLVPNYIRQSDAEIGFKGSSVLTI